MTKTKRIGAVVLVTALGLGLAACTSTTDPDQVGLYYLQGSSDGNHFDHCTKPGQTDDYEWNNQIVFLPTSGRSWKISDDDGADSKDPIIVSAAPQKDQPSGVQVKVWSQTKFVLNTYCDDNGGEVKPFWEKTGRRYEADTAEGWRKMLLDNLVPALQKVTRDTIRLYGADALVGNIDGVQTAAQKAIGESFSTELNRLAGGPYFCGPSFDRTKPACPPIEFAILDIEYADPGIQAARNEKQKAMEEAAANVARAKGLAEAAVAEAQGKVEAAAKLRGLLDNPAWLKLQLAQMDLQAVQACGQNPNCHMVIGADGNLVIQ